MSLKDVSDEELAAEIERRRRERNKAMPEKRATPDWSGLLETIDSGVKSAIECESEDGDFEHYVYEAAMEAVFVDYFEWRNSREWDE